MIWKILFWGASSSPTTVTRDPWGPRHANQPCLGNHLAVEAQVAGGNFQSQISIISSTIGVNKKRIFWKRHQILQQHQEWRVTTTQMDDGQTLIFDLSSNSSRPKLSVFFLGISWTWILKSCHKNRWEIGERRAGERDWHEFHVILAFCPLENVWLFSSPLFVSH